MNCGEPLGKDVEPSRDRHQHSSTQALPVAGTGVPSRTSAQTPAQHIHHFLSTNLDEVLREAEVGTQFEVHPEALRLFQRTKIAKNAFHLRIKTHKFPTVAGTPSALCNRTLGILKVREHRKAMRHRAVEVVVEASLRNRQLQAWKNLNDY